jgi:hypothetical protein
MQKVEIRPLPEMLGRKDKDSGAWQVDTCAPVRGKPMTNVVTKHMVVPVGDEQVDRVIRAHEMAHARFSPADDFPKWIERKIATENALIVVEEVRVNFLIKKAGFDVDLLADGSELTTGMRVAEQGDWASAVYTAVGYSVCGGGKDFLTGVRRVNRAWGTTLRDIVKAVEKEFVKAHKTGTLGSTEVDERTGLAPMGFAHTERIAEWIDRLANPPVDENENEDGESEAKQENEAKQEGNAKKDTKNGNGATDKPQQPKADPKKVKPTEPSQRGSGAVPTWGKLIVGDLPLTRKAHGGLGRKRVASNMGRNPRRIGNALADPEKRVFDRYKKGNGGIVLIDGSGSMSLNNKNILDLTEASPGCTVAVYSADRSNVKPNLLILAKDGKMVDKLPERNGGNGVDGEAIRWAIKQRKRSSTPIVWITDGQVHGLGTGGQYGGYHDILAMDCIKEVLKHKVFMAHNVTDGLALLKQLSVGKKPQRWYPRRWQQTYQQLNGKRLG